MEVRGLLVYCVDYRSSHSTAIGAARGPDDVRLSDLDPRLVCKKPVAIKAPTSSHYLIENGC
jgi:hypothetical protein